MRSGQSGQSIREVMDKQQKCFICRNPLSSATRYDQRSYRRSCCGIFIHHVCIRDRDFTDCPSCAVSPGSLLWEPLAIPEKTIVCISLDSSDDESEPAMPPLRKKAKMDLSCVICLEGETDGNDPLLEALCCHHMGHLSCLRRFYEIPAKCNTEKERTRVKKKMGIPKCFICRAVYSNNVRGLEHAVPALLPKVTGHGNVISVPKANAMLDAWYSMFEKHINEQTKHCHYFMSIKSATGWAMRQDGTMEMTSLECSAAEMKITPFRLELMRGIKRMIRRWAGISPYEAKVYSRTISKFCLDNIIEVSLTLELANSYHQKRRSQGPEAQPFDTELCFTMLSVWQLCGHFFDFQTVCDTFNSKIARWNNTRIDHDKM